MQGSIDNQNSTYKTDAGRRILVVDDDMMMRTILCRLLEKNGFQVTGADDGDTGLDAYRAQPVDLVIADLNMPRMHGLDMIAALREMSSELKIVALSGGDGDCEDAFHAAASDAGADETVIKPFDPGAMVTLVNALLAD